MFAVVETCGKQYRVEPGARIIVDQLGVDAGSTVKLERVLLLGGDDVRIGTPTITGASVTAKVVDHFLGDKRITFKYGAKKRFRRRVGYRPHHTTLEIISIDV